MVSVRTFQAQRGICKLLLGAPICPPSCQIRYSTTCLRSLYLRLPRRNPRRTCPVRPFATVQLPATRTESAGPTPRFDNQALAKMQESISTLLSSSTVPKQESVEGALADCEIFSRALYESAEDVKKQPRGSNTPASTLLSLEKQAGTKIVVQPHGLSKATREKVVDRLSSLAYSVVSDPKVFISPIALASYVATQCWLGRPETLPQVFVLYANKPIPRPGSSPPQLKPSKPSTASSAIPLVLADAALNAAILAKDLPLCLDIINTSACTSAFKSNKFIRRALLPATALALAPIATYTLASHVSVLQDTMDQTMAQNLIFAGTLAYVAFTAMIGFVAITTSNDQMKRVTWATGLPLRERWLREEERAFVDKLAMAWGFQDEFRRGEEEGQDWEALKEWAGLRGMIVDRVEFMEGME